MMRSVAIILAGWLLIGAAPDGPRILIFSHTTGYRHASIEPGIAAIKAIAAKDGIAVEASEAPALFDDPAALARFDAIVLLSTTTDPKKAARGAAGLRARREGDCCDPRRRRLPL
jgi:hypothetical protein